MMGCTLARWLLGKKEARVSDSVSKRNSHSACCRVVVDFVDTIIVMHVKNCDVLLMSLRVGLTWLSHSFYLCDARR